MSARSMAAVRTAIENEVDQIVTAAERIIRYANEIPTAQDALAPDFDRIGSAERLLLAVIRDPHLTEVHMADIRAHFRRWSKGEVLL